MWPCSAAGSRRWNPGFRGLDCAAEGVPHPSTPKPDLSPVRRADDGTTAFCHGIAYVHEGSRLGGEVLYRRLHGVLAPHPLRYLRDRSGGGFSWPAVLAGLRSRLAGAQAQASACRGAVAAFEVLLGQFGRAGCGV